MVSIDSIVVDSETDVREYLPAHKTDQNVQGLIIIKNNQKWPPQVPTCISKTFEFMFIKEYFVRVIITTRRKEQEPYKFKSDVIGVWYDKSTEAQNNESENET